MIYNYYNSFKMFFYRTIALNAQSTKSYTYFKIETFCSKFQSTNIEVAE